MSNRSYLAVSDSDSIYPSFAQKGYDPQMQLVASDVEALPLLWLALFREGDLQRKVFNVQGQKVPAFAPICTTQLALERLKQAVPYLSKIFTNLTGLAEYGVMFQSAIESLPYRFISIELEEIAGLYPPEHRFEELLALALRGFDKPEGIRFHCDDVTLDLSGMQVSVEGLEDEDMDGESIVSDDDGDGGPDQVTIDGFTAHSHADVRARLACLRPEGLPSVRMYLDDIEHTEDEAWNFTRVLGAGVHGSMGYGREVPWEKEDADFGWSLSMDEAGFDDEGFDDDLDDDDDE